MAVGGLWSATANLGVFVWALQSGRSLAHAMTMTFVSLVLIQFLKAYAFRSERHFILQRPFANKWLNLAVVWELVLLLAIVYIPFLEKPFGTFPLGLADWGIVLGAALTILPVLEIAKWMKRKGWFGAAE
jgi:Ca2+-transporting ATPase